MSKTVLVNLRIYASLNILQAVCFYNAENILFWLRDFLRGENDLKENLATYREPAGGN